MINHKLKLIFIHIPKTGGISISNRFFNSIQGNHQIPQHKIYKRYWNKYFKFTFVRNPWDRLVSGYFFSITFTESRGHLPKQGEHIKNNCANFTDFVMLMNKDRQKFFFNPAFRPQRRWLNLPEGLKPYDFIGRFEHMNRDVNILWTKIFGEAKPFILEKLNTTLNRKNYQSYYTEETKQIVTDMYKEEIMKLNYKF